MVVSLRSASGVTLMSVPWASVTTVTTAARTSPVRGVTQTDVASTKDTKETESAPMATSFVLT